MSRFEGKLCPVCRERFKENDETVVCPVCGTPHHRACYSTQNKCALEDRHGEFEWNGALPDEDETTAPEERPDINEETEEPTDKSRSLEALEAYLKNLEAEAKAIKERDDDSPEVKLDKQIKREIEGMMGIIPGFSNPETDEYYMQIRDNLANPLQGLDGVSMRELTFFTATSIWHFSKTFAPFCAHTKKASFNLPSGFFAPVYQFFRKMDGLAFVLLVISALSEGVPYLLLKLGSITETAANAIFMFSGVVMLAVMVLLCIFGDYLYYRHSVKQILKIRKRFEGKTDNMDYYHELYRCGRPSMLKGLFGCLAMAFVQVFIQVFLVQ